MKLNPCKLLTVLIGLTLLLAISGCASAVSTAVNTMNTKTATIPFSTLSRTPTSVPTFTPTWTPGAIPPTSIPTLPAGSAADEIYRLLSGNDACLFPCWWELFPGKTRIIDAQNYLASFGDLPVGGPIFKKNEGFVYFLLPQSQNSRLRITFEFEGKNGILELLRVDLQQDIKVIHPSGEESYEISWGDPKFAQLMKPYSISSVFSKYGQPAVVLVFTHQVAMLNQPHPLSLVVFYPERGFMIEYVMDTNYEGIYPNLSIKGCPSLAFQYFWFWEPAEEITVKDVVSRVSGYQLNAKWIDSGKFRSLEEATGMSIEDLHTLYTTDENACITTPADMWPMPGE